MQAEEMGFNFNNKDDVKESEVEELLTTPALTEMSKSELLVSEECNINDVFLWSKNELVELESINEAIKNFDKMEVKLKYYTTKYKIGESKLDE